MFTHAQGISGNDGATSDPLTTVPFLMIWMDCGSAACTSTYSSRKVSPMTYEPREATNDPFS
jgi:hypothetical protein